MPKGHFFIPIKQKSHCFQQHRRKAYILMGGGANNKLINE